MCVQVFHLTLVVFVAAMAAAGCEANKEIYSTCANSHTHTYCTQAVAIECNFAWYIKNFLLCPVPFFSFAFWVPIVCNISAVGGRQVGVAGAV